MGRHSSVDFLDPLYGDVHFSGDIADLCQQPLVQRLRQIRLSNIDSLSMPSIANISRYEHSLGTCYIASQAGLKVRLSPFWSLVLEAASLIHDSGITPFGHLAEEALAYIGVDFKHEEKWHALFSGDDEVGGFNYIQLYLGRESGLRSWAERAFSSQASEALKCIIETIEGQGRLAGCVAGQIDLDNIDNVSRVAYHLGLNVDKRLPIKIAEAMIEADEAGIIFDSAAPPYLNSWLELRSQVYNRLMLARDDFIGKLMLLYAMVQGYRAEIWHPTDWRLVDFQLLHTLTTSSDDEVSTCVKRWLTGELWSLSDLFWLSGTAPSYATVDRFSHECTSLLKRQCFAYRIKDKRTRRITVRLRSGEQLSLGTAPSQWLLGVGSPLKREFTLRENQSLVDLAESFFCATHLADSNLETPKSLSLF